MKVRIIAKPYELPEPHRYYVGQVGDHVDIETRESYMVHIIQFTDGTRLDFIAGEFEYLDIMDVFNDEIDTD